MFDVCPAYLHTSILILLLLWGDYTANVFPICLSLSLLYLMLEVQVAVGMLRGRLFSSLSYIIGSVVSLSSSVQDRSMGSHLSVLTDGEGYDRLCCAIVLPTSHLLLHSFHFLIRDLISSFIDSHSAFSIWVFDMVSVFAWLVPCLGLWTLCLGLTLLEGHLLAKPCLGGSSGLGPGFCLLVLVLPQSVLDRCCQWFQRTCGVDLHYATICH